jgi:hypothetical protein
LKRWPIHILKAIDMIKRRKKNHIEITSVAGSSNKLDGTKRDTSNAQGGTASRSAIKQNEL